VFSLSFLIELLHCAGLVLDSDINQRVFNDKFTPWLMRNDYTNFCWDNEGAVRSYDFIRMSDIITSGLQTFVFSRFVWAFDAS